MMKLVEFSFVTLAIFTLSSVQMLEMMIVSLDEVGELLAMIDEKEKRRSRG